MINVYNENLKTISFYIEIHIAMFKQNRGYIY